MKNEFSKNRKKIFPSWNYFLWMFIVVLVACNTTNDSKSYDFDPSKEVTITEFSPKSGSAHSKLFIYGNNLGVDTAKIKVYIGGEKAPVIGCDGECIYCLVPAHSEEGSIEVKVKDGTTEKSAKASERFIYISRTVVSTLCGYTTSEGKYEIKDGSFDEAGFGAPYWLSFDPKNHNHLFLLEQKLSLRLLDLESKTVTTLVTLGEANWTQPRTLAWSHTGDTLYVANDQDGETSVGITMLTRSTGFRVPQTLLFSRNINHVSINPVDGTLFYSTWWAGELFRYDWTQKKGVHAGNNSLLEYHVMFHPSGNYAYIFSPWAPVIQRANYNWSEKNFRSP
ncbi:MAG: IPT/TIG domain-containing protein [Prevotella sp.]|jgi:DNA-binding beta-propeller fold protein YncE|nr:IPT/TIG domain-containing protein [Prevotella sp.]